MNLLNKSKTLLTSCDKNPLASKTLWINGITMVAGIAALVNDIYSPAWVIPVIAATNMILRFLTTKSIVPKNQLLC